MRNITINGKDISQVMEEKALKFLYDGKYKEAYELFIQLKSKNKNLDKINFALGFICELEAVEGTNFELAESYYYEAIELGSIEAKNRMALLAEKGKILNINEAYNLYNEVIEHYKLQSNKLPDDEAKSLANNAAFAYYRLGRMYEKSMFISKTGTQDNKLKALELYDLSLSLYNKYQLNNLDKARVLNRIGWIKYAILLEENNRNETIKIQDDVEAVEKIFNESNELANKEAKLGLLNIQAFKHALIKDAPGENIMQAKSCISEALSIDPNHLPTLLLAARIKTIAPTAQDHRQALDHMRKAMKIAPDNYGVKKKFDEIISYQARNFAKTLEGHLRDNVQETIKNASKKGASQETINKSQKLQEIFYSKGYSSTNWVIKQTYSQASLDKYFEEKIAQSIAILTNTINHNKFFRELYDLDDQEILAKQIAKSILENDRDLDLIKFIVQTGEGHQLETAHLDQIIVTQCELFYHSKNQGPKENLLLNKEGHKWISAQEEFIKLFCEKFRKERNTIESIASGQSAPLRDMVDNLKYKFDRAMQLQVAPPLSYLVNALGGSAWQGVLASFATDYVHSIYKEGVILSFVAADRLLPRREEANALISSIAQEFASKYSAQIANIKDYESLNSLAEITIERIISHVFAQTGIVKQIQESISNKVNSALNFVIGNEKELKPINAKQLLYKGIWYGKSSENKRIRTLTETREFEDNWEANELLERTGVITKDKRIFGNIKNVEKYGCASGDEVDVIIRRLQPINQSQLSLELKGKLNETYEKQQKMHSIIEQTSTISIERLDNIKTINNHGNFSTVFAKGIIGIGVAFLLLSLAVMYIPLLSIASSIIPGLIAAGSFLSVAGMVLGRNAKNYTTSNVNINDMQVDHKNEAKESIKVKIDKIKGPTPLDSYNKQEHRSSKVRSNSSLLTKKPGNFISRISSNATLQSHEK